jgi:hypothetical protein
VAWDRAIKSRDTAPNISTNWIKTGPYEDGKRLYERRSEKEKFWHKAFGTEYHLIVDYTPTASGE